MWFLEESRGLRMSKDQHEKYQIALDKIRDSINHEWRNHGWRNMSNEEVDRDVSKAWSIIEELVDKERLSMNRVTITRLDDGIIANVFIDDGEIKGFVKNGVLVYVDSGSGELELLQKVFERDNCPNCNCSVDTADEYCFDCGQAIDWSEDE